GVFRGRLLVLGSPLFLQGLTGFLRHALSRRFIRHCWPLCLRWPDRSRFLDLTLSGVPPRLLLRGQRSRSCRNKGNLSSIEQLGYERTCSAKKEHSWLRQH